ncbi:GntR family transcriptional regulator [Leucobacter coleopterorum]|uniref:GntR family transcriptional regulator n=1 Tax=Leucobacter coleopterorum TaxID=2714933 RepID=UPI001FCCBFF3|nr:GntR family transcriptional regulator [Leucobacter coleopterorum]
MRQPRPHGGADAIPVYLDRAADAPLPVQLAAALREAIDAATLRPGEGVPATRDFARRLGVARGVVVTAYEQLIAEGYLTATHGQGTRVNPALEAVQALHTVQTRPLGADSDAFEPTASVLGQHKNPGPLAPGKPITDAVDSPAWRAAWRAAAGRAHLEAPELGDPRLREEIADHLRRMRGTARLAQDVLVTAGTRDGLGLLLTALGTTRGHGLVVGLRIRAFHHFAA